MTTAMQRGWVLVSVVATLLAAVAVVLLQLHDPNALDSPFPGCSFHALTGWYCVGCGTTRALHALVHGDPLLALRMNALVVIMLPLLGGFLAWQSGWRPRQLRAVAALMARPMLWIWLLPAFGVLRNLPWQPFSWLAPG